MARKYGGFPPVVSLVNRCDDLADDEIKAIAAALTKQVKDDFDPAWGCPATVRAVNAPDASDWQIVFLNDAESGDSLGYHELTLNGQPVSKVFVRATRKAGQKVSTTASHELLEMLIDPFAQMWAQHSDGAMYAYEVCDAVEEVEYQIGGMWVSDFVYPSFFESWHAPNSTKFDREGKVTRPFETLRRGYQLVSFAGQVSEVFVSEIKARHFREVEDRTFHRGEYRKARAQAASPRPSGPVSPGAMRADALRYASRHLMALADEAGGGNPFPDWGGWSRPAPPWWAWPARLVASAADQGGDNPFPNWGGWSRGYERGGGNPFPDWGG